VHQVLITSNSQSILGVQREPGTTSCSPVHLRKRTRPDGPSNRLPFVGNLNTIAACLTRLHHAEDLAETAFLGSSPNQYCTWLRRAFLRLHWHSLTDGVQRPVEASNISSLSGRSFIIPEPNSICDVIRLNTILTPRVACLFCNRAAQRATPQTVQHHALRLSHPPQSVPLVH
jgi:hypothetical protein